jgi:competence protein ComEC
MVDLSIVYLIIVSGFHLAIIKKIIHKILEKYPKASYLCSLSIIFFYTYLLNFSVSAFRVFLSTLLVICLKNKHLPQHEILGLAGLISLLFGPSIIFNIGFCLSYLCTAGIIFIVTLNINNVFLEKVLFNLIAILIGIPFVLMINHNISF